MNPIAKIEAECNMRQPIVDDAFQVVDRRLLIAAEGIKLIAPFYREKGIILFIRNLLASLRRLFGREM